MELFTAVVKINSNGGSVYCRCKHKYLEAITVVISAGMKNITT